MLIEGLAFGFEFRLKGDDAPLVNADVDDISLARRQPGIFDNEVHSLLLGKPRDPRPVAV